MYELQPGEWDAFVKETATFVGDYRMHRQQEFINEAREEE